jgi:hypothetical protein
MPTPTRDEIKPDVIGVLSEVCGVQASEIKEEHHLEYDLGLNPVARSTLAPGFGRVARKTNPAAVVTKKACQDLKRVGEAIDLVHGKAGT